MSLLGDAGGGGRANRWGLGISIILQLPRAYQNLIGIKGHPPPTERELERQTCSWSEPGTSPQAPQKAGESAQTNTYLLPGREGCQLLDLHGLVVVAFLAQQELAAHPLLGLGGVAEGGGT